MVKQPEGVTLRRARPYDMKAVYDLISELALYEKAPEEVTITVDTLVSDGFDHNLFKVILAEQNDEIVGMAFYYPRYSTWKGRAIHLEDFVVRESHRRLGIGRMLFEAVVHEAVEFGAQRMQWEVLDWNTPAINFYNQINADLDETWITAKLTESQLANFEYAFPEIVSNLS